MCRGGGGRGEMQAPSNLDSDHPEWDFYNHKVALAAIARTTHCSLIIADIVFSMKIAAL